MGKIESSMEVSDTVLILSLLLLLPCQTYSRLNDVATSTENKATLFTWQYSYTVRNKGTDKVHLSLRYNYMQCTV